MSIILGLDGVLGYTLTPIPETPGTPSFTEVTLAKDVTTTIEDREADISNRSSIWAQFRGTLRDVSVEFQMEYDPTLPEFTQLQNAWENREVVGWFVSDRAISAGTPEGMAFNGTIFTFSRPEALEDSMKIDITIRPVDSAFVPDWWSAWPPP